MASSQSAPLFLYTARLPGGIKLSIFLEELRAVYGGPNYEAVYVDLSKNVQKEPWFIKYLRVRRYHVVPPQQYDREHRFSFDPVKEADEYTDMVQWTFFANTGLGHIKAKVSNLRWFLLSADEDVPYAKNRKFSSLLRHATGCSLRTGYLNEVKRLYGVFELRLKDRDYLAGAGRGKYTVADINVFPWYIALYLMIHAFSYVRIAGLIGMPWW
ncbi:hypothetical protein EWM64_g216 [Hericium alpestre]|uniref:Uncharacterized protein n=1 Tax=Hericium alpestre TaxID=135208 RepID=A0A4Z0ABP1_9AGAM|nr:hypothetical protein EWM64_g216 [Hericium alpestre]